MFIRETLISFKESCNNLLDEMTRHVKSDFENITRGHKKNKNK